MLKIDLTEQAVRNLPYADGGQRIVFEDASIENLRLAVGESSKTFFYAANLPGSPKVWIIGRFGQIRTEWARDIARRLGRAVKSRPNVGSDATPPHQIAIANRIPTFGDTVRGYAAQLPNRRHNRSAGRDAKFLLHYLVDTTINSWADKPITEVSEKDILALIDSLRDRPALAHCCIRKIRTFYLWAMQPPRRQSFGLTSNPAANFMPYRVAPYRSVPKNLFEEEMHAYLVAVEALEPPYRAFAEALALTGLRPSELSRMKWAELDLSANTWTCVRRTVSGSFKTPFSDKMALLLEHARNNVNADTGEYVFSTTNGRSPIARFSELKSSLDRQMATTLGRHLAWRWTDLRRSVRFMMMDCGLTETQAAYALGSGFPRAAEKLRADVFLHLGDKAIRTALNAHAGVLAEVRKETT